MKKNLIFCLIILSAIYSALSNPLKCYGVDDSPPASTSIQSEEVEARKSPTDPQALIDEKKLQVAKDLTDWLQKILQHNHALVAVVGRQGSRQTKQQDKTGMGHAGLAVYDPRAQTWILYNLLNDLTDGTSKGAIWRTAPLDFFYEQKGYEKDALILIPDSNTQQKIYEAVLNGNYKKLFFTDRYNLLSEPGSNKSLNCNKWLLMNIFAAKLMSYDTAYLLAFIDKNFKPGVIKLNYFERRILKQKMNVRTDELPSKGSIRTVTVESLYRSNMFYPKIFYSGREL